MILFDSHCHLDDKSFDNDLDRVLERARDAGVKGLALIGIDTATSQKAVRIARQHPCIVTSAGVHPHDASHCSPDVLAALATLARENDCVRAWGETGLDFFRNFSPRKDQEACFSAQLAIAGQLDLPLVFHERASNGRFYEILKAEGPKARKGVVHCFSGTKEELFKYLDLGYHIGITGIITIRQRGALLRELAPLIPEDRILIETDAPYLTPAPQKNKTRRNEPAFVSSVLEVLAEVRDQSPPQLARQIFDNTQKFYGTRF